MTLMHCPFCGEEERVRFFDHGERKATKWTVHKFQIVCDRCSAMGPIEESTNFNTARDAAKLAWNNRIPHHEDLALPVPFEMHSS